MEFNLGTYLLVLIAALAVTMGAAWWYSCRRMAALPALMSFLAAAGVSLAVAACLTGELGASFSMNVGVFALMTVALIFTLNLMSE